MNSSTRYLTWVAMVGLLAAIGCGGPAIVEVTGTVKLNGKALDKIQVQFCPEQPGPRSMGMTDESGRFTLKTDDGQRDGAMVGSHRVVLIDTSVWDPKLIGRAAEGVDISKGKKSRIPMELNDVMKTTVKKDVTSGGKNDIEIDLK